MSDNCSISIVLPCYKEERFIATGVEKIMKVMNKTTLTYEIILVDDASPDRTRDEILRVTTKHTHIRYLLQDKNTGRGKAFINGAKISKGKIVGFLDIDQEISIDCLPEVIKSIQNGYDVCIVKRAYKIEWSPEFILRHIASVTYKQLVRIFLNLPKMDTESGFKFFKRKKLFQLLEEIESAGWFFDTEIMALAYYSGMKIAQQEGVYKKNHEKSSTVNLFSDSIRQFLSLVAYRKKLKKLQKQ